LLAITLKIPEKAKEKRTLVTRPGYINYISRIRPQVIAYLDARTFGPG